MTFSICNRVFGTFPHYSVCARVSVTFVAGTTILAQPDCIFDISSLVTFLGFLVVPGGLLDLRNSPAVTRLTVHRWLLMARRISRRASSGYSKLEEKYAEVMTPHTGRTIWWTFRVSSFIL